MIDSLFILTNCFSDYILSKMINKAYWKSSFMSSKRNRIRGQKFPNITGEVIKKLRSEIGDTPVFNLKGGPSKMKPPVMAHVTQDDLLLESKILLKV